MNCNLCEISNYCKKSPQLGTGQKTAKIMFISDCPSPTENANNEWMSDKEGNLLKNVLEQVGIPLEDCYFTGAIKCPTPDDGKGQRQPIKEEIENCAKYLEAEMELVQPKIIVPMGNISLKKVYGKTGITKHRGKAVEGDEGVIIFPIIHPELLFRQPRHSSNFVKDLQNLGVLHEKGSEFLNQADVDYRYLETLEEVEEEIERLTEEAEWLVFDLETTGLNPFLKDQKIVCISLTDKDHYGVTIPLQHKDFTWEDNDLNRIIELLKGLLENKDIKKVAHNGKFDMKWLMYHYGIDVQNLAFDPLLAHYVAVSEERGGHGLKELAWEHTDMGGYDNKLDEYKQTLPESIRNSYDNIPWEILREYAAADVDCTMRLVPVFKPLIDGNPKWKEIYQDLFLDGSYAIRDIELNGVQIDPERLKLYQEVYPARIQEIEDKLRQYPEVVQIEREKQKLFALRQQEMKKPKDERDPEVLKWNKYKNFKFNFGSVMQLRELLFEGLGLSTPFLTDKGEENRRKGKELTINDMSTGKETLEYLEDKHPIAGLLSEWRRVEKLYGTYVAPAESWIGEDGLVHGTYNLTGTVTSRLSSEAPNMQNFPRESNNPHAFEYEYGVKKLFSSRFGDEGVMLQFDYCLSGDTLVRTAFQGDMKMKDIVARVNSGEDIYVYSCDPETNDVVVSKVERGLLTFRNKEVYDVYLDNGEIVRATAEHPFMLRDGSYVQVKDLKPNTSLMGFREYLHTDPVSDKTYRSVGVDYQNKRLEHRIITEYFHDKFTSDMVVHHKDGEGLNNSPENLEPMTQSEHWSLHLRDYWSSMTAEERTTFIKGQDRWSEETKQKLRENATNMWENFTQEEYDNICKKIAESVNNKGENNPMFGRLHDEETRAILSERQRNYQRTLTQEERNAKGRKMTRAKLRKIVDALVKDDKVINHKNYEEYRKRISPRAPRWEHAYEELVMMGDIQNHKVVMVVPAGTEDVYDIKVENHSNFALSSGVFVHNSQLELRVAAIFSQDERLLSAYREGKDLHIYAAAIVRGIPEEEVTSDMRTAAKAVNFGLLYGKGANSLAEDMGMSLEDAQEFINKYFEEFSGMKKWLEETREKVQRDKHVETLSGFWRRLPGVDSNDRGVQGNAFRQSVNAPIQGSGANMTMKSIILINSEFKRRKLKSVIAITVHDSIVADVHVSEFNEVYTIMKTIMENLPFSWLSVPIVSEAEIGRNYGTLVELESLEDLEEYEDIFDYIDTKVEEKHQKLLAQAKK